MDEIVEFCNAFDSIIFLIYCHLQCLIYFVCPLIWKDQYQAAIKLLTGSVLLKVIKYGKMLLSDLNENEMILPIFYGLKKSFGFSFSM